MTFHTTPQFHTTISHHTLFFTTPFCTTSHSVVHLGHRHSTSYNIPFHITSYNKYISSLVSFKSALSTHLFSSGLWLLCLCACDYFACVRVKLCAIGFMHVCVPATFHKCCSVYVISRVQIAFNILHIIPSHHTKRFYITPPFTSHHSTPHHYCTTFHIILLHTSVPRHISQS